MTATANGTQGNILVVDDESQITRVLRTALSGHGYMVRTAGDGDFYRKHLSTFRKY